MTLEHDIALSVLHDVSFDAGGIGDDMNASHLEPSSSLSSVDLPHDPTNITAAAADDSDMHMPITEVLNDLNNIEGKQSSKEITSGPQKPPQSTTTFFSQAWMKNFEKLKQYKEMHGDCNVPTSFTEDYTLRDWVRKQRTEYKKAMNGAHSAMSKDRIDILNSAGFEWENPRKRKAIATSQQRRESNYFDDRWEEMFMRLKYYKRKHGNALVPTKYNQDKQLGNWVCSQRTNKKQWLKGGYTSPKNIDRFKRLDEIGFIWNIPDFQATEKGAIIMAINKIPPSTKQNNEAKMTENEEGRWLNQFEKLKKFKAQHGHCNVTNSFGSDPQLLKWVYDQRQLYKTDVLSVGKNKTNRKSRKDNLSRERITFLNTIGFNWEPIKNSNLTKDTDKEKWSSMFNTIKKFRLDNNQVGPLTLPDTAEYTEVLEWVKTQKIELEGNEKSVLSKDMISSLDEIGIKDDDLQRNSTISIVVDDIEIESI